MNNFTFQDLESLLNNEPAMRQLDNASDLISKYGDNLMFLRTANKQLEESRLLTPIAVREHFTQPYKMGLINDDLEIVIEPKYDTIVDDITQKNQSYSYNQWTNFNSARSRLVQSERKRNCTYWKIPQDFWLLKRTCKSGKFL